MNVVNYFIGMPYSLGNHALRNFPVASGNLEPGDLVTHDNIAGSDKIVKVTDISTQTILGVVDYRCTAAGYGVDPANNEKRYQVFTDGEICIEKPAGFDPDVGLIGAKIVMTGKSFVKRNKDTGVLESVDGLVIKLQ